MANENETIADIIAEARDKYTVHDCSECEYRKSCDLNQYGFDVDECREKRQSIALIFGIQDEYFTKLLCRLEAAHNREVQDALDAGGYVEAARKAKPSGDTAKLREALVRVLDWLKRMNAQPLNTLAVSELTPSYAVNRTARSIIEDNDYHISQLTAALAAPPRNCDRMNVDDAFSAFSFMCDTTDCKDCPYKQNNKFGDREFCAMLFLYDNGNCGKEGGNNGR